MMSQDKDLDRVREAVLRYFPTCYDPFEAAYLNEEAKAILAALDRIEAKLDQTPGATEW